MLSIRLLFWNPRIKQDGLRPIFTTPDGKKLVKEFRDISKQVKVFDTVDERFYTKKP